MTTFPLGLTKKTFFLDESGKPRFARPFARAMLLSSAFLDLLSQKRVGPEKEIRYALDVAARETPGNNLPHPR